MTRISHTLRIGVATAMAAGALLMASSDAAAQGRGGARGGGPRGGGGPVVGPRGGAVVAAPIYYYGYGPFDPFWGTMWSPYWGWYGPYGFGPWDRGFGYGYDPNASSARIQVKPKNAEVYVDGYLAGTVDDFDGALQRLNIPAGEHAITLYLEGYRTITQNVLFRPRATVNIKYDMEKLSSGESSGARPEPGAEPPNPMQRPGMPDRTSGTSGRQAGARGEFGTLLVRVQPQDAVVYVDGQEWQTGGSGPLSLELPAGMHDVEVRQDGFEPFRRVVSVRPGNTTTLNVSLSR